MNQPEARYLYSSPELTEIVPASRLASPRNGWRAEYDADADRWYVTGPERTTRTYVRHG
jgi:hypothetical protein